MLKVLEISLRADYGGGPEHMFRLMQNLSTDIKIFAAAPKDYPYWERYSELLGTSSLFELPHRSFRPDELFKLASFCRRNKIQLIHAHGKGASIYGRFLGLLLRVPVVYTFHGIQIGTYGSFKKTVYLFIERVLGWFTSSFISVSDSEYEQVKQLAFCNAGKVSVIYNGVVVPEADSAPSVDNEGKATLLMVSRFDYAKNVCAVLDIMRELGKYPCFEKTVLVIAGGGPDEDALRKGIIEYKLEGNIILAGFLNDINNTYRSARVYLSTSRWEGLPLAVMEAMAHGLPVVLSNVTGNRDLAEHAVDGYLYDPACPAEAAGYIARLLDDEALRLKMGKAAADKIRSKYSVKIMAARTEELYKRILSK